MTKIDKLFLIGLMMAGLSLMGYLNDLGVIIGLALLAVGYLYGVNL